MQRKQDESFDEYKTRRKEEQARTKMLRTGVMPTRFVQHHPNKPNYYRTQKGT